MNLYELLEVSENASKEIIEKVYKIKVKKYHPDLQRPENRNESEKKMKEINEAYDILSDDFKRKQYDDTLKNERFEEKQRIKEQIIAEYLEKENRQRYTRKYEYGDDIYSKKANSYNANTTNNTVNEEEMNYKYVAKSVFEIMEDGIKRLMMIIIILVLALSVINIAKFMLKKDNKNNSQIQKQTYYELYE